jgi:hypothetical protein
MSFITLSLLIFIYNSAVVADLPDLDGLKVKVLIKNFCAPLYYVNSKNKKA